MLGQTVREGLKSLAGSVRGMAGKYAEGGWSGIKTGAMLNSNKGFNAFTGFMGANRSAVAMRQIGRGFGQMRAGNAAEGLQSMRRGGRNVGRWMMGSGQPAGARQLGAAGARSLSAGFAAGATADFLNPWGLGWGD